MRRLVAAGRAGTIPAVVPHRGAGGPVRLGPAQEDLWVYEALYPGTPALNLCQAYHFAGPVDPARVTAALALVCEHHDILRARISGKPGDLRLSFPTDDPLVLEREDLRGTGTDVAAAAEAFRRRPFDLARDRLIRARFVTVDDDRGTLLLSLHHIITDWWSYDVLQSEFAEAYRAVRDGTPPRLTRPALQYADFACWQRELEESGVFEAQLEFWGRYLARPPSALTVPGVRAGDAEGIAQIPFRVDAPTADAVRALARERGVSAFVVLMAAFAVLAQRLSGADDMVLGTPMANRSARGLERVMGYVMNVVPTRWRIRAEDSFDSVLSRFAADFPDLVANADVPVGRIVTAAAPERSTGRSPLFQWVFMHLVEEPSVRSLREFAEPERIHTGGEHDLVGALVDSDDGMEGSFEIRTEVFSPAVVARWTDAFVALLRGVTTAPGAALHDHDLVSREQRARLLDLSAGPVRPAPESLPGLVARHAARTPDAPALSDGDVTLTYAELADRVGRLAAVLREHGAGAEKVVALALGRTPEMVVAALAVQWAGAAYLPIDLDDPADHVRRVLEDAAPVLLVTDAAADVPASVPHLVLADLTYRHEPLVPAAGMLRAAYVGYAPGPTGRPNGVTVTHAGIAALAHSCLERFGLDASDRVLQFGSPSCDVSVGEAAAAFACGGTLVVAPAGPLPGAALGELLTRERLTFAWVAPSVLATVPDGEYPALRAVAVGARACPPDLVARWAVGGRRFHTTYGPTEATGTATASGPLTADGTAPTIGTPVAGARVYLLDERLRPVPVGSRGEVYVAGGGLARGYLARPRLTAERFVADPYGAPGARMYRTGDLARWRDDGRLDFVDRADDQATIPEVRAEPSEVRQPRAPRDEREQAVCTALAELLGRDEVSVDDNFFDLGGYSLLAIRLVSVLRERTGAELPVRTVLEARTVAQLAAALRPSRRVGRQPGTDAAALAERRRRFTAEAENPGHG